ncbi:hypothetical protein ABZ752_13365 [Streptomyces roseifaciens]
MTHRITRSIVGFVIAALAVAGVTATTSPAMAAAGAVRPAAVTAPIGGDSTTAAGNAHASIAAPSKVELASKEEKKKKKGFFAKLGKFLLVVVILILLFFILLIVGIVYAAKRIFRRRG